MGIADSPEKDQRGFIGYQKTEGLVSYKFVRSNKQQTPTMAEKGELPPVYPIIQDPARGDNNRKWLLGLMFYAGAVTAALVVMATMGSLYLGRLEPLCQPRVVHDSSSGQTKEVVTRHGERMVVDPAANKEIIYPSGEGLQGSIVVIDHNKGIIGIYMAAAETCFLIGGVDSRLPNATELLAAFQKEDGAELGDLDPEDPVSLNYVKASDWPVQDLTLLPRELHAPCWGKPVHWLERRHESVPSGQTRIKRGARPPDAIIVGDDYIILIWYAQQ